MRKISLEPLIREVGSKSWYSHRYYINAKLPFHPSQTKKVANYISNILANIASPRLKLVITDLDNTMWEGIVGEDGTEGVGLNYQEKGYGHLRLQKMLLDLNQRGVLLAIASKNNFEDAVDVFKKRPEMILKEKNFSSIKINWDAKSKNIKEILSELNLSTTGVVFLDDMPFEREEVGQLFPDLIIPQLSKDSANWVDELLETGIFFRNNATISDVDRLELYNTEKKRQDEKTNFKSEDEFLSSLNLVLKVRNYSNHKDRILELIAKTNQFNLTTRRYNTLQFENLIKSGGRCFAFELEDKFGNYGIISVLLALPQGDKSFIIDTWLMSCRVINRKVENAILSYVLDVFKNEKYFIIHGEYLPTAKNKIVSDLYLNLGFDFVETKGQSQFFKLDTIKKDKLHFSHFCRIETEPFKETEDVQQI